MSIPGCWPGLIVCCLALAACRERTDPGESAPAEAALSPAQAAPPPAAEAKRSLAEEGRYLVDHLYECGGCHTPKLENGKPDPDRYLAGVVCVFDVDPTPGRGCVNSKNLTHHARGLANVTDDRAIKAMFLDGRRPDGKFLHATMPSYGFHNMPAQHADAIVAFLRAVPGVDHFVPPSEPPFDQPAPLPTPALDLALVPAVPAGTADHESAERGRVLVAAACLGCHTPPPPKRAPGVLPLDTSRLLAGGRRFDSVSLGLGSSFPPVIYSGNLTQHATGLLGWSANDVVRVLVEGKDREGKGICPPMPAGPGRAFHGLRAQDARDIANYVMTLRGIDNASPNGCAVEPSSAARIYGRLSETGLYADGASRVLAAGVTPFAPRYELWSDAAEKRRWIALPPGTKIDTSAVDHWSFPVGTRVWKEFRRGGRRLETRLVERTGPGPNDYWMGAFAWDADGRDARFVEAGASNVLGTSHDVPAASLCASCHGGEPGRILGFSAVQLAPSVLGELAAAGRLSQPPPRAAPLSGSTGDALGYLHANCGHCHGDTGLAYRDVDLLLRLDFATAAGETATYRTGVRRPMQRAGEGPRVRIEPGRPEASALLARMRSREPSSAMPPMGSEQVDADGVRVVAEWIGGLGRR